MPDLNSDALGIWEHLKPAIDKEIEQKTRGMVQRRKMKVTTAPSLSTGTIGVTEAFGTTEMVIPFATNLISATVGDMVWVEFMYGATNAFASMFASADEKDWDVAGDLTVHGVLDVTPRRCEATLSAIGWYRAIVYNAYNANSAQGSSGEIVTIRIVYTSLVSVQHEISLFMTVGKVAFLNETSHGTTNLVDQIRYRYNGSTGYIDIHWTTATPCYVNVSFDVASRNYAQRGWVAGALTSVADSPSGETELARYTFSESGTGNLTVNGVLDVTKRRCEVNLSQVGWYRVMTIAGGNGRGGRSFAIDINITRTYNNSNNEVHYVKLLQTYNAITSFADETSKTNTLVVDKIRYTIDSNSNGHLDIHYNASVNNDTAVDFTVHTDYRFQYLFTAESLQSVADSPSGESVVKEYTFAANVSTASTTELALQNRKVTSNILSQTTYTFIVTRAAGNYAHFLMYGGTASTRAFLYIGFIGVDNSVVLFPVYNTNDNITFSATYDGSSVLTITASSTCWGGIHLISVNTTAPAS